MVVANGNERRMPSVPRSGSGLFSSVGLDYLQSIPLFADADIIRDYRPAGDKL